MDGSELADAEDVGKECRHAGEAAAVAGDDGKDECLEDEAFSGNGELMESKDFKEEEYHVGDAAADPVGNAGPYDTAAAIDDADDADEGSLPAPGSCR